MPRFSRLNNDDGETSISSDDWRTDERPKSRLKVMIIAVVILFFLVFFVVLGSTYFRSAIESSVEVPVNTVIQRLPGDVIPSRYKVMLTIPKLKPGNLSFVGNVSIFINVKTSTDRIYLHGVDLILTKDSILQGHSKDQNFLKITSVNYDEKNEMIELSLERNVTSQDGEMWIHLHYTGKISHKFHGFFTSQYFVKNTTRLIAATKLNPTGARRLLPCFDEPEYKSTFEFTILHRADAKVLFNVPSYQPETPVQGITFYNSTVFELYKYVPLYSISMVLYNEGDLTVKREYPFSRLVFVIREELSEKANYTYCAAHESMGFFGEYTGVNSPLTGITFCVLPSEIENPGGLGLINIGESLALYDDRTSTSEAMQGKSLEMAKLLGSQWFGGLVTPSWWSELTVSDGVTSYLKYLAVEDFQPQLKVMDQFAVMETQKAFGFESFQNISLNYEVNRKDDLKNIFDRARLSKTASVFQMLHHGIGEEVFQKGIRNYLRQFDYKIASHDDLWKSFDYNVEDVKAVMDKWTLQTGFPVVTVDRDYQSNEFHITQERFKFANKSSKNNETEPLWYIPITYTYPSNLNFTDTKTLVWMTEPEIHLSSQSKLNEWVIFNVMQTGYYRVNYDKTNWQKIIAQLQGRDFGVISTINRAQLVDDDDALNLARAGRLDYPTALELVSYLSAETEYLPWKSAIVGLSFLDNVLVDQRDYEFFKEYVLQLLSTVYQKVGFHDSPFDQHLVNLTRTEVLAWACGHDHEDYVSQSKSEFGKWRNGSEFDQVSSKSANLKSVVYCTGVRLGGVDEWSFIWNKYLESNDGSEKNFLLDALGCTQKEQLIKEFLDKTINLREQDVARVFKSVASHSIGQPLALNYVREKWNRFKTLFGWDTLYDLVKLTVGKINTEHELKVLREFEKEHRGELGSARMLIEQAVEQGEINVRWLETNHETIIKWLKDNDNKKRNNNV